MTAYGYIIWLQNAEIVKIKPVANFKIVRTNGMPPTVDYGVTIVTSLG